MVSERARPWGRGRSLDGRKTRVFKNGHASVSKREHFKNASVSKMVFGPLLSNGRQRVGAFLKRERVSKKNACKHSFLQ